MKCSTCQKEQNFLMRGKCPACYKEHGDKDTGIVGEVMEHIADTLIADPERLNRPVHDFELDAKLLRSALVCVVGEDDLEKLREMKATVELVIATGNAPEEASPGLIAIQALIETHPENHAR